jgi:hypothetical protein
LKNLDTTEATRFILPMLSSKDRNVYFFVTKNFDNCFIGDNNHPELGKKIFLLYTYQKTVEYIKFERKVELTPWYNSDYDYGDENQVIYVFDVPTEFLADFQLFQEGKYSQFSNELKIIIRDFWDLKEEDELLDILYTNSTAKEKLSLNETDNTPGEYWPKPILSREIYMNPN